MLVICQHPTSPLFPYTTLFRSSSSAMAPRSWADPSISVASSRSGSRRRTRSTSSPPAPATTSPGRTRSEEHTSELQSLRHLVCRLLLEKKKKTQDHDTNDKTQE